MDPYLPYSRQQQIDNMRGRLLNFSSLKEGWMGDGQGEVPEEKFVLQVSSVLLGVLGSSSKIPVPAVYPTPEGGVQAEWDFSSGWAIDLEFDPKSNEVHGGAYHQGVGSQLIDHEYHGYYDPSDVTAMVRWLESYVGTK